MCTKPCTHSFQLLRKVEEMKSLASNLKILVESVSSDFSVENE